MTKNNAPAALTEAERNARKRGAARLNRAMRKALSGMTPPDDLTVSQWAEVKRRLSAESAAEPGPWRTARTPYLQEPMDAFTDPKVRHIVMVAASQVGKSEFLNNCIGYIIDEDPGSILFIQSSVLRPCSETAQLSGKRCPRPKAAIPAIQSCRKHTPVAS